MINSRSKSATRIESNNNNQNSSISPRLVSSSPNDSNLTKTTIFGVNESPKKLPLTIDNGDTEIICAAAVIAADSENNMNCVEYNNVDLLDDIKFIDSDDSDRKHSPGTMKLSSTKDFFSDATSSVLSKNSATATLPSNSSAKKINEIYQNKYNTISNGTGSHQIQIQIGNDIGMVAAARKAIAEDMMSSTSSSTSTLSALTESSASSFQPNNTTSKETVPSITKASNSDKKTTDNVSVNLNTLISSTRSFYFFCLFFLHSHSIFVFLFYFFFICFCLMNEPLHPSMTFSM